MPIVPPAPGRFSTTTGWPSAACSLSATGRAMVPVAEPGVNGTMMRIGLEGNDCAAAVAANARASAANIDLIGGLWLTGVKTFQVVDPAGRGGADPLQIGGLFVNRVDREGQRLAAHQQQRGARQEVRRPLEEAALVARALQHAHEVLVLAQLGEQAGRTRRPGVEIVL